MRGRSRWREALDGQEGRGITSGREPRLCLFRGRSNVVWLQWGASPVSSCPHSCTGVCLGALRA